MNASDPSPDDQTLLQAYSEHGSERAFAELVGRHMPQVYAAALRRVNGDRSLAADVTQTVFTDFARKASALIRIRVPGGWLHRHTGFVAGKLVAREKRHRVLEQEAAVMNTLTEPTEDPAWAATAPFLDAALDALPTMDRDALVLRFFEHRDFRAVGTALGVSDDTAQKRVNRALEKLRRLLTRRGSGYGTAAALPALLMAFAVPPAPAALAASVPGKALAMAAARPAGWWALLHGTSGWQRTAACLAAVAVAAALPVVWQQRRVSALETENASLLQRLPPAAAFSPAQAPATHVAASAVPDVSSLITQAAQAFRGGSQSVSAVNAALGFLTRITPEQMSGALARIAEVPDASARPLLYKYLLSYWAEKNPSDALAFARNQIPDEHRTMVCEGVLTAWAARNPESMLGWKSKTGTLAAPPVQDSLMATVFKTLASQDPDRAFQWLVRTDSANGRAQALRGMMETVQTEEARQTMLRTISRVPDEEVRLQARRAVVEHWAQQDPGAAAAWVDAAQPPWERTRLMDSLGFAWLQTDPAAAADWWLQRAPGPDTLVKIINIWAQENPNEAGTWLAKQPLGPPSDTARMTFARQVNDLDPESALAWADTVSDAALRESTIDHIWRSWNSRDTAAAGAWLGRVQWPAERTRRLSAGP
jgi:RNA polymerase sigma factor (sigma-70 family)